jgi:thiamine-phosphate pyrophosphorylase
LLEQTAAIVAAARPAGALVIVNDRADVAAMSGADGVHVGQDDLSPALVRRIVGDGAVVGLSTHTVDQLEGALRQPVSYVAVGPVFATATKATGYEAVGLDLVRRAAPVARAQGIPLVAIGGITLETAPAVLEAGASAVAVIGDLVSAGDPAARVRAYVARLGL